MYKRQVQNTEVYNEKLIVYSLGNFIFDQQFNSEVRRGIALDVAIDIPVDEASLRWLEIADSCVDFKDSCQDLAKSVKKSNQIDYSFDIIATRTDDLVTARADDELDVLSERTNWIETQAALAR